eukprot:TRINITY_DN3043_c0_g1_i1.p1 TRINITY_DN3043_c0_g1~~TRINITY_DN3043_c0_g1_i1.p1  ORF type:complete len:332 (+),score=84.12 TRINITY_DN3043_c0_g1_i1:50-1045(+)
MYLFHVALFLLNNFFEYVNRFVQFFLGDNLGKVLPTARAPPNGTAIVTGGNSGIGLEIARELARIKYRVIIACRTESKAKEAIANIKKEIPSAEVEFMRLDLSSLESVRKFATEFTQRKLPLHLLVNNAGGLSHIRYETEDGYEQMYQANYLSHYLLTHLLIPVMRQTKAECRIINVSSVAHFYGILNLSDLSMKKKWNGGLQYGNSKLHQVLFSVEMQKRLNKDGNNNIAICACHPGFVYTPFYVTVFTGLLSPLSSLIIRLAGKNSKEGARTELFACLTPDFESIKGQYLADSKIVPYSPLVNDEKGARKLYDLSASQSQLPVNLMLDA